MNEIIYEISSLTSTIQITTSQLKYSVFGNEKIVPLVKISSVNLPSFIQAINITLDSGEIIQINTPSYESKNQMYSILGEAISSIENPERLDALAKSWSERPVPEKPKFSLSGCLVFILLLLGVFWLIGLINSDTSNERQKNIEYQETLSNALESISIPGLTGADIVKNLESKGFTINKEFSGAYTVTGTLTVGNFGCFVSAIGASPTNIKEVSAVVSSIEKNRLNNTGKSILQYLATLPYDGNNPIKAKEWVDKYYGKQKSIEIGKATFELDLYDKNSVRLKISRTKNEIK